jgi:hypothetical protein
MRFKSKYVELDSILLAVKSLDTNTSVVVDYNSQYSKSSINVASSIRLSSKFGKVLITETTHVLRILASEQAGSQLSTPHEGGTNQSITIHNTASLQLPSPLQLD